jgi:chorismate mutase
VKYTFYLKLTAEQFLSYYRGEVDQVIVTTTENLRVKFPAVHLRKYMTPSGVEGVFCLETENNKFKSLAKLN